MAVFNTTIMAQVAAKQTALQTMHADIQTVLAAEVEFKSMEAYRKLREFDQLITQGIVLLEGVEATNDDLLPSPYPAL